MPTEDPTTLAQLKAELEEVSRRDAAFRLKTAKEHVLTEARLRELQDRKEKMDTYVHGLHVERDALRAEVQAAHADVEAFTWMLLARERDAESLARAKQSFWWPLVSGSARVPRPAPRSETVPAGDFLYYLHTSPFRLYRPGSFTLRGWLMPRDGRAATAVRVAVDDKTFYGQAGLEEPEVVAREGSLSAKNPRPGFQLSFDLAEGRHELSLEAQIENSDWQTVLALPVWCVASRTS